MDSAYEARINQHTGRSDCYGENSPSELTAWFLVPGDTEDFIFYGETERKHSEK